MKKHQYIYNLLPSIKLPKLALIWFVMVFSLFANDGYGAHLKGADIEYKCISGSQYEVTLYYYWDCTPPGLGVATTARANNNFDFTNSCGLTNPNPSFKLINPGGTEITQICPSAVSSCTNTVT